MQKAKDLRIINIESLILTIRGLECSFEDWGDEESVSSFRYGFSCAKDKVEAYLKKCNNLKEGEYH